MNEELGMPQEVVMSKIYEVRGVKVMLDRDLAEMYAVKAIRLREQVKRNADKFPAHFMFQLTDVEVDAMVSQNAIPSRQHLGGALPYVFTEYGLLQLANVLRSERATKVSIKIIEVFVKMREILLTHKDVLLKLDEYGKRMDKQDEDIQIVYEYLSKFIQDQEEPMEKIGFKQKGEESEE